MTSSPTELGRGSGRLWLAVAAVFAIQIGLIFALSDRSPMKVRTPVPGTVIRLSDNRANEILELEDPTLFALPHPKGFSGAARLPNAPIVFRPADWVAPSLWLPLPVPELVADFKSFAETSQPPAFQTVVMLPVQMTMPVVAPTRPLANHSRLRIEGPLQGRPMLSRPVLRDWPSLELLSNSIVQVDVDAQGRVFSPVLLSNCGLPEADQFALALARRARFAPLERSVATGTRSAGADWTSGTLIFEWETSLPLLTNGVPGAP